MPRAPLNRFKCQDCRRDRQACHPIGRPWPGDKCHRCSRLGYPCSASLTKQGISRDEMAAVSAASSGDHDLDVISIGVATGPRTALECLYNLRVISWETTGLCPDNEDPSDPWDSQSFWTIVFCFFRSEFTPANLVLYRIWQREAYLRTQQEFSEIYCARLQDMPRGQAKDHAKREYIQSIVQRQSTNGLGRSPVDVTYVVRKVLRTASRWAALVNACGSIEIILLDQKCLFHDKTIGEIIEQGTNEEFESWRRSILSPDVNLKEDCMRLSGVVRMIINLSDSKVHSEVRNTLANEVRERFQLWGDRLDGGERTDQEEPILSLPEIFRNERLVNEIFGFTMEFIYPDPDPERSNQDSVSGKPSDQVSTVRPNSEMVDLFDFDPFMYTGDGLILGQEYDEWMQDLLSRSPYALGAQ